MQLSSIPQSLRRVALTCTALWATCSGAIAQGPMLVELLAKNDTGLVDEDGDHSDWIEIYNAPGIGQVDLGSWSLSDDAGDPFQWTFLPGTLLPEGGILLVFASDKDRRNPSGNLHTNFKLSGDGEYLGLRRPNGSVASEYAPQYPVQSDDVSFGLDYASIPALVERYFTTPSPGAPNLGGGPAAFDAQHSPRQPSQTQDLIVRVTVPSDLGFGGSVMLNWRVMYEGPQSSPMLDNGAGPDLVAGDGVYTGRILAGVAAPGQMLRYQVRVIDGGGGQTILPVFSNPLGSPQYYGTVVQDPALQSELPIWQWFVADPAAANTQGGTRCSLWIEGQFYDNVEVHRRGASSASYPRKSYKFDFNPDERPVLERLGVPIDEANINTHWADKASIRQALSYGLYDKVGCPTSDSWPLRLEQNGAFFSVQTFVEEPDRFLLERLGKDPDGALYKMASMFNTISGSEKITRKDEGKADLQALVQALLIGGPNMEDFLFDNLDVPEVLSYLVATWIMHDNDHIAKNYYVYRDSDGDQEWSFLPWDKDLTWGRNYTLNGGVLNDALWHNRPLQSHVFFGDQAHPKVDNPWNRLINRIYESPRLRAMYVRRLRTVCDEVLQTGIGPTFLYLEDAAGDLVSRMAPDMLLDEAKWGLPTYKTPRTFLEAVDRLFAVYVGKRRIHFYGPMSQAQGGDVPLPERPLSQLLFSGYDVSPASGLQSEEYVRISNPNPYSVDISEFQVVGGITMTLPKGTVIEPGGDLYLSPEVRAFRARSQSPKAGEGHFVVGPYEGEMVSPSALRLIDLQGLVRAQGVY